MHARALLHTYDHAIVCRALGAAARARVSSHAWCRAWCRALFSMMFGSACRLFCCRTRTSFLPASLFLTVFTHYTHHDTRCPLACSRSEA
eukprot:513790-Pleurochrysis_carterae.AAC.1